MECYEGSSSLKKHIVEAFEKGEFVESLAKLSLKNKVKRVFEVLEKESMVLHLNHLKFVMGVWYSNNNELYHVESYGETLAMFKKREFKKFIRSFYKVNILYKKGLQNLEKYGFATEKFIKEQELNGNGSKKVIE